jgi:hypothetical protein
MYLAKYFCFKKSFEVHFCSSRAFCVIKLLSNLFFSFSYFSIALSIYIYKNVYTIYMCVCVCVCVCVCMCVCVCVCVCLCPGITLERLERFQPNFVHILLYACVRILCTFYIYSAGKMVWKAGNLDD